MLSYEIARKYLYASGANFANLAHTHGSDSSGYIPYYNMESAAGWNDLYNLIDHLDQGAGMVTGILNIVRMDTSRHHDCG